MYSARTTVQDLQDHTGPLDPPTDLLNVKKEILLKYISHLRSKLEGKDEAIEKLSVTFQQSLSGILEKSNKSITEPLQEDMRTIKESIEKISLKIAPIFLNRSF